jgi:hypothetical protein
MSFTLLGSFWNAFPDKKYIEDIWSTFQPYVDSAVSEFNSVKSTLGLNPDIYHVSRKDVHETVDTENMNVDVKLAHGHSKYSVNYSSPTITVVDPDADEAYAISVNGVRLPDSESYYDVEYTGTGFTVTLISTNYTAGDDICIYYYTDDNGYHTHRIKNVEINDASGSPNAIEIDGDSVNAVWVNGVLYPDDRWTFVSGVLTFEDPLGVGDEIQASIIDSAAGVNHFHDNLYSEYSSLTVSVPAHFNADIHPFINGIMTPYSAGVYGTPPLEFYLAFSESFNGYYNGDLVIYGNNAYKSKLSTTTILRLVNASNAVYEENQSFKISGYTIRDDDGAWLYHDEQINKDLYCEEAWYDETMAYRLFGNIMKLPADRTTQRYIRLLKAIVAYRLAAKTEDRLVKLYSALFDVPLNLIAGDTVYNIETNSDNETIIFMTSGAEYNVKLSNAVVNVNDALELMQPLCDAIEIDGESVKSYTASNDNYEFTIPDDPVSAPGGIRRTPAALYQADNVDLYSPIYGPYFDGPWQFDA